MATVLLQTTGDPHFKKWYEFQWENMRKKKKSKYKIETIKNKIWYKCNIKLRTHEIKIQIKIFFIKNINYCNKLPNDAVSASFPILKKKLSNIVISAVIVFKCFMLRRKSWYAYHSIICH